MTVLVTGATGKVGRHIVSQLHEVGHPVRALSRAPARADLPAGVEVAAGDLTRPESLATALTGVTAAHLINFGGDDYAPLQTGPQLVELLSNAGVRKVTMLSGWDESTLEPAVRDSDLAWTYLQPTEFMANALDWAEAIRTTGTIEQPRGTRTPMIHEADIAAAAVAVLAGDDDHGGQAYPLTGPELLSVPDKLRHIGTAIGRGVRFVELSEAQAREKWAAEGMAPEMIDFYFEAFDVQDGSYPVTDAVPRLTGRPARTFAQWAVEHADAFR